MDCLDDQDAIVGTTGMLSRELFEYRLVLRCYHIIGKIKVLYYFGTCEDASQILPGDLLG